jgi:ATP-dependent DNA helicase DinG
LSGLNFFALRFRSDAERVGSRIERRRRDAKERPFASVVFVAVHEAFAPGGALAATLPGFEARPEQAALAAAVEQALETGEHLVAEAGTGTGKSLAYLLPALASGRRVVVATATKALQEQLLAKDVPAAAAALGREVRVAVLKGRQNYVCRKQLQSFGPMLLRDPRDEEAYELLQPWLQETETGDRAELPLEPSEALWAELAVGADRCAGRRCPFLSSCFAEAARTRASEAELVIANHALYFADIAADGGVLPEHDAVVFDEAHRLEETAATWLGGRVSRAALRRLSADVERACREAGENFPARAVDRIEQSGERLLRAVAPHSGRRRLREIPVESALVLIDALAALAGTLEGRAEGLDQLSRRALDVASQVEACLEPGELERVVWAEPDAVAWAPVDVSSELRDKLWSEGPTAILVSATLTTGDDARFVRRRLGLDHARELVVGSPFDFREQALLYVPHAMPDPRADGFTERVADEVVSLLSLSRGRALVLTSSYRALDVLRSRIVGRVPYAVLVQGEAPRERLLEQFREDVDSVLLATSTFWQGIDVPGESLSLLVIDKLPFSAPGDPLHEARCEAVEAGGGDWFRDYALPTAMLQLRQGFGRLIRSHGDHGVVAILDPRLRTKAYGRAFLKALPRCPMVEERAGVAAFFGEPAQVA